MFITILKLVLLAITFNVAMTPVSASLATFGGYAAIILSLCLPFAAVSKTLPTRVRVSTAFLIFMGVITLCSCIISFGRLDMDLIKSILSFFCCYSAIMLDRRIHTKAELRQLLGIGKLLGIIYIAYTYLPLSFRYTVINEWGDTLFTLGMGNPNATSMSVMFCVVLIIMDTKLANSLPSMMLDYAMAAALFGTLVQLQSRTVVVCCSLVIAVWFFDRVKIRRYMITAALIAPVVMMGMQIWLGSIDTDIEFLGKKLATGRDALYLTHLSAIASTPTDYIWGRILLHRLENYHNAPLAIVMNFGVLGYLCYLGFWNAELTGMAIRNQASSIQRLAVFALLVYAIHSSTEAAPMLGVIPYGTQLVILARCAKDTFQ